MLPFSRPALVVAYKSGCVLWMPMSTSDLQQILGRLENIGALPADLPVRPPVTAARRISSSDMPTYWQEAYAWLKAEANRVGWTVTSVYEDSTRRRIRGRIVFIMEMIDETMVRVRAGDGISFEIVEGHANHPEIYVTKRNWPGRRFLVYHTYEFHAMVVYPTYALLSTRSLGDVENTAFQEPVLDGEQLDSGRVLEQYSWWIAFLRQEKALYEPQDPRRIEIDRILGDRAR